MNDFCLFACSDGFQLSDGLEFIRIIQDLCQQLGIVLNYMTHTFEDDELNIINTETLISTKNLHRLDKILSKRKIIQLLLWSNSIDPDGSEYRMLDAEFQDYGFDNYKYVCIYFQMGLIENWTIEKIFSFTSNLLNILNHLGKLDYAFITVMDDLFPQTYFREIFTSGLSKEEALNLAMWKRKFVDRKKRLRGLYWGNMLSPGHLAQIVNKREFLEILDTTGCLYTSINGDDLFFMFPSSGQPTPAEGKIETLLNKYNLLMHPDDEARDDVDSSIALGF
jgi:hypothetical protein